MFRFTGFAFCKTVIFDLLWIASLCAIADYTVRYIDKQKEMKNMIYQKYVRIIRSEKAFQYDKLRREKLLANEIEVNRINKTDSEKIERKEAENEAIESIKEVVSEEEEVVDISVSEEAEEASIEENVEDKKGKGKTKTKSKKGGKK